MANGTFGLHLHLQRPASRVLLVRTSPRTVLRQGEPRLSRSCQGTRRTRRLHRPNDRTEGSSPAHGGLGPVLGASRRPGSTAGTRGIWAARRRGVEVVLYTAFS